MSYFLFHDANIGIFFMMTAFPILNFMVSVDIFWGGSEVAGDAGDWINWSRHGVYLYDTQALNVNASRGVGAWPKTL